MYTFGYLREAVQAHIDLDEQETQAMHLQDRYHIFANEAMQAICGVKPKYDYFICTAVAQYTSIINLGNNEFRKATNEELNWESQIVEGMTEEEIEALKPNFADDVDTKLWYEGQNIYLLNTPVRMPGDFIVFAEKQAWVILSRPQFNSELFIKGYSCKMLNLLKQKATTDMFMYAGKNSVAFLKEGQYYIPYKGVWYQFKSGISDDTEIDMPIDIFLTIPLYIAALCLQIDHIQRATAKRNEFEAALARCANTDFLSVKEITPSFK